jgi:hypothetical protein
MLHDYKLGFFLHERLIEYGIYVIQLVPNLIGAHTIL